MKLFFSKGACSLAVRIIINEIGMDSLFESVNLRTKKTESGEDFLTINPKGGVPTLELHNGEILTENAVILQYLCDKSNATGLLPQIGDFNRYQVLEWVNYVSTELHKGIGILFNQSITQELKNEIFIPLIKTKLNYVNHHLQNNQYLLGDEFRLPDAHLFVMLLWTSYFDIDLMEWKNLTRYFDTLKHRTSIEQSLKQEEIDIK